MCFSYRLSYMKSQGTKRGISVREWGGITSSSEHDFKDLLDGQDGIASCKSFHPQNRIQDERKGMRGASRKRRFFLCGFARKKQPHQLKGLAGVI